MEVKIVRTTSLQGVGPNGPFNRVFAVGDVVDVPEMQARVWMAQNNAVLAGKKAAPAAFKEDAIDGDGDGLVQDGTEFERPAKPAKKTAKKN